MSKKSKRTRDRARTSHPSARRPAAMRPSPATVTPEQALAPEVLPDAGTPLYDEECAVRGWTDHRDPRPARVTVEREVVTRVSWHRFLGLTVPS